MPELPPELRETVARVIYEWYRESQEGREPSDDPATAPWDALPESLKESSRGKADRLVAMLAEVGLDVRRGPQARAEPRESFPLVRVFEGHASDVVGCGVSGKTFVVSASLDGTLKLWGLGSGEELRTLVGHGGPVTACAVASAGEFVVSAGGDKTLKLWDPRTGEALQTFEGHTDSIEDCAVSADGSYVVSACRDGTLKLWDVASGRERATFAGHSGPVHGCAIGTGGDLVVSAGADGTLRLWDARTGAPGPVLVGHNPAVWACAVDPGGRFVVSGGHDGTVRIWDPTTAREMATFRGHVGGVHACAVTPDGERVVSAGNDGAVRVWESESGEELATLEGHAGVVWDCAVGPDGSFVVSAGSDGTLRLWDLRPDVERAGLLFDMPAPQRIRSRRGSEQATPAATPAHEPLVDIDAHFRSVQRVTVRGEAAPERVGEPIDLPKALDPVDCTVFAPPRVRPGDELLVQVFAHTWEQTEAAVALAQEFDVDAERRGVTTLEIDIAPETRVTFHLAMPTLVVSEAVESLVWKRRPASVQFAVSVPDEHRLGAATGKVTVCVDGVPRGTVTFKLEVVGAEARVDREPAPVGHHAQHHTLAFISYASENTDAALHCFQTLSAAGIRCFQDILGIEPGERWKQKLVDHINECNLFLLVWSKWARDSEWVEKEFDMAIGRKQGDELAPPTIGLYILEDGVKPWPKYSDMHFRDPVVHMRRGLAGTA